MSNLHDDIDAYLRARRALGYKLEQHEGFLFDFAKFLERSGSEVITTDLAVKWATQPGDADPSWWAKRLGVIRVFAKHQHSIDPRVEIPPDDILVQRSQRADPYLYTENEILSLQAAARTIRSPLRRMTYETLIGLLAVTGMRVGEAIGLDRDDINWTDASLVIRQGKLDRTRWLPLHESTMEALDRYQLVRKVYQPDPSTPAFFVSTTGNRLIYKNVQQCFKSLTKQAGIVARSERCRPRIHDLRHRFAVVTLTRWYHEGCNIDARLPALSEYLGHVSPSSTYWYLTATPELLTLAAQRLEAVSGVTS